MTPELSRRVAAAFEYGNATIEERDTLRHAVSVAGVDDVDDLPSDTRELLLSLERRGSVAEGDES